MLFGKLGRQALDEALVRTFVGKGIANLVKRSLAAGTNGAPDAALFDRALPMYMDCYESVNGERTTIYPGVREGLNALKTAALPLACVTNKSERFTLPLLKRTGLADYFKVVVAGDTLPKRKPDPLPLNDAQAARAAGCPVFCVSYGYNEGRDVRDLDVDAIVATIFEATRLIVKS